MRIVKADLRPFGSRVNEVVRPFDGSLSDEGKAGRIGKRFGEVGYRGLGGLGGKRSEVERG